MQTLPIILHEIFERMVKTNRIADSTMRGIFENLLTDEAMSEFVKMPYEELVEIYGRTAEKWIRYAIISVGGQTVRYILKAWEQEKAVHKNIKIEKELDEAIDINKVIKKPIQFHAVLAPYDPDHPPPANKCSGLDAIRCEFEEAAKDIAYFFARAAARAAKAFKPNVNPDIHDDTSPSDFEPDSDSDSDEDDKEYMQRDEVVKEIKRFKEEFIEYADTNISLNLQGQIIRINARVDVLYTKFTELINIPELKSEIVTLRKDYAQLQENIAQYNTSRNEISNKFNEIMETGAALKQQIHNNEISIKEHKKLLDSLTGTTDNNYGKMIADLQAAQGEALKFATRMRSEQLQDQNKIDIILTKLAKLSIDPPKKTELDKEAYFKLSDKITNVKELTQGLNDILKGVFKRQEEVQDWMPIIKNLTTRVELLEAKPDVDIVTKMYKGIFP